MLSVTSTLRRSTPAATVAATRAFSASSPSSSSSQSTTTSSSSSHNAINSLYYHLFRVAARGADELVNPEPSSPSRYVAQQKFKPTPIRNPPPLPKRASSGCLLGAGGRWKRSRGALVNVDPARIAKSAGAERGFASSTLVRGVAEESLDEEDGMDGGWQDAEEGVSTAGRGRATGALRVGDFVESTRNGVPLCGIYLGQSPTAATRGALLTTAGTLSDVNMDSLTFVIPSFVDAAAVTQFTPDLVEAFEPDSSFDASNPAVLAVIQSLRQLELAVESETQQLVPRGADDLYRILLETLPAPGSPEALGYRKPSPPTHTTVQTALRALQCPVTPLHPNAAKEERVLALHRILLAKPEHFIADPLTLRNTGRFDLRPRDEVERFEKARDWVRSGAREVTEWAEKAAKLREWGRERRQDAADAEGSGVTAARELKKLDLPRDDPIFVWSQTELTVLTFLRDTLAFDRLLQEQPHMVIAPTLVKLVDQASLKLGHTSWGHEREVNKTRLRTFLGEVGAVAPWENWTAHERTTGLQQWEERGILVERALAKVEGRSKGPTAIAASARTGALTSTEYYPTDPHDSVRHDFGSARVFTIDDLGASELDDGISLSPAPPSRTGKSTYWVHVHVADPTAVLHPGHLLAKLARVRDHTEYFPEKTWAMLPESFTVGQKLSLGSLEGGEQRVLSFGIRIVGETGEVIESEVKAGVVRNVLRLTYGAVDKALGYTPPERGLTLSLGTSLPPREEPGRVTDDAGLERDEAALAELRTLHGIAIKLLRRRVESSAIAWNFPRFSVSVAPSLLPQFSTARTPTFYASTPRVDLHLPSAASLADQTTFTDSPASLLVSELMVAANRAAAKFAVEHSLAVPFRQQGPPASPPSAVESVFALRNPANGFVPGREVLKRGLEFSPGTTLATPGPHWPMGINDEFGYVQATSPLRRYSDLFTHYQLKSALLPSSSSSSSSSTSSKFAPAFKGAAVQAHLDGFNAARKGRYRLSEAAESFWALWVIKHKLDLLRSLSSPSSSLPVDLSESDHHALELLSSGLTALALRAPTHSAFDNLYVQRVIIPQLGVRGTLQLEKVDQAPRKGEEVKVKIEEVVLSARSTLVVGLRK
ncbi:hypothetical protein JCM11641_001847 [Rhodosporidiobolus odoratus]